MRAPGYGQYIATQIGHTDKIPRERKPSQSQTPALFCFFRWFFMPLARVDCELKLSLQATGRQKSFGSVCRINMILAILLARNALMGLGRALPKSLVTTSAGGNIFRPSSRVKIFAQRTFPPARVTLAEIADKLKSYTLRRCVV